MAYGGPAGDPQVTSDLNTIPTEPCLKGEVVARYERCAVELPADSDAVPPCVKLHGLLPAPRLPAIRHFEPARTDDPHHRRCGVGYYTDTEEEVFCALPGIKQSVYRAELHAVARALEECSPHEVVSDCKGVVKAVQALQTGRRQPKGRNRDLELTVKNVFHFWRLVGPNLRERPDDEPRVRLPRHPAEEDPEVPVRGMVYPEAQFRLGSHLRVVRHEDFLQCLECTRITGKVRGDYNFAYMTRQACRRMKKRKQKKRRTGFATPEVRITDHAAASSQRGTLGSSAAAAARA
eukprot:3890536-Amphidinium_carterae.1